MRSFVVGLACSVLAAAAVLTPHPAHACGGTFCDRGPQAMPVDQKGENIIFVTEGSEVEAHIQIQYKGDAARFAWVLPVPALPKISVGSQPLFDAMLQATVPTFGLQTQSMCTQNRGLGTGGSSSAAVPGAAQGANEDASGPKVVQKGTAGAFDYVVLQGGTGEEVVSWLGDNGYAQPESTATLLQHYLEKKYLFVAVKLTNGEGLDSIHPLVVRYEGNVPCVPLELTAVGALENMGVRTFFLGDKRWVPTNYKHVELNPLRLDWVRFANNYDDALTKAIDSPVADGHAFITEYAGASSPVSTAGVYSAEWKSEMFANIDPTKVVDELRAQGIASCQSGYCQYSHPLIQGLLQSYLPRPAGVTEAEFYSCLSCYKDQIDMTRWDAAAWVKDYEERIVSPGKRAVTMLSEHSYLTRLYTTISPAEMSVDPEFLPVDGLPDVRAAVTATRFIDCDSTTVALPDGRMVGIGTGQWPTWGEDMPYAEKITDFSGPDHKPVVLVDNTNSIDVKLSSWNGSLGLPASGKGGVAPEGSGSASSSGDDGSCSVGRGEGSFALGLLALSALAAGRRRRRAG